MPTPNSAVENFPLLQARGLERHVAPVDEGSAHHLLPLQWYDWHSERLVQQGPLHAAAHHPRRRQPAALLVLLDGSGPLPLLCVLLGDQSQQGDAPQ